MDARNFCVVLIILILAMEGGVCKFPSESDQDLPYKAIDRKQSKIAIMVHYDAAVTLDNVKHNFKKRARLRNITETVLRDVEKYFNHNSLNKGVKLHLLDAKFLRNNTAVLKSDDNGPVYLKNYCEWQSIMKKRKSKWYFSLLFTGLDLYYFDKQGNKVRSSTARTYLGGICNIEKSCTILEWKPKNLAYLLTHEIGHSLGLNHDGFPNKCKDNQYIMSSKYNPYRTPKTWSKCSQKELEMFMKSRKSWCLK